MLLDYDTLLMLKRLDEKYYQMHEVLENKKDETSNNVLVICRNKKDCKEALRAYIGIYSDATINKMDKEITIDGTTIIFVSIKDLDLLDGRKYKEYYFDDEFFTL